MRRAKFDPVSWRLWLRDVARPGVQGYMPSPAEIEERRVLLEELQDRGLPDALITSVMVEDTPTLEVLRRMLRRYGVQETWRRVKPFIVDEEDADGD